MTRFLMTAALVLAIGLVAMPTARAEVPLRAVPELDAARYAGTWYEIARLPNRFERKCEHSITATYAVRSDGGFDVTNRCVQADGEAMSSTGVARQSTDSAAKLEVRFAPNWLGFLPFVWADYWVIGIDGDYQWAIVGEPGREYLWFLSRTPSVSPETLESLKARARMMGYELDELIVVPAPP